MIHDSSNWKKPLVRSAKWLEKLLITHEPSERILARAEREIFVGFYAIRKLRETFKLTNTTKLLTYNLIFFNAVNNANHDYFNRHDFEKHYDLNTEKSQPCDIGFICNQVIHSFIFVFSLNHDGNIDGIYLSSDRMKRSKIYFVPLTIVIHIFRKIGHDYPSGLHLERNRETGQWTDIRSK